MRDERRVIGSIDGGRGRAWYESNEDVLCWRMPAPCFHLPLYNKFKRRGQYTYEIKHTIVCKEK